MELLGEIVIPNWRPTRRNDLGGPGARYVLSSEKAQIAQEAWAQGIQQKIKHATKPRYVEVEIRIPKPARGRAGTKDRDNRESVMKQILDGLSQPKGRKLVGASLIVDDSDEWVRWSCVESYPADRLETIIRIYE